MAILQVRVKPQSRTAALVKQEDGTWRASLKSPPIDGRANEELVGLVAAHFQRRKSQVRIKTGNAARLKRVEVDDLDVT